MNVLYQLAVNTFIVFPLIFVLCLMIRSVYAQPIANVLRFAGALLILSGIQDLAMLPDNRGLVILVENISIAIILFIISKSKPKDESQESKEKKAVKRKIVVLHIGGNASST